jgi:hypothetical protein
MTQMGHNVKCVALLESGEQRELAQRVLERSTGQTFEKPAEWRKWLETNAAKLRYENRGVFAY